MVKMQKRVELRIETTEEEMRKALEIPDGYYISQIRSSRGEDDTMDDHSWFILAIKKDVKKE